MLRWLEQFLTYKPDNKQYQDLSPFSLEVFERGDSTESITIFSKVSTCRPVILFFHGNRGNISFSTWHFALFEKLGYSYLSFNYPGYGESKGTPSEESLYRAGERALKYLTEECHINVGEIIFFGVSLGGAVAVELATRYRCRGLILESVFNDTHNMGRHKIPLLPLYKLVPNRFRNREKIHDVSCPLFLLHGTNDETTPVEFGLEVFELHPGPKEKMIIEGAGHVEIGAAVPAIYAKRVEAFISSCPIVPHKE